MLFLPIQSIGWRYSDSDHSAIPCCTWGCHDDKSRCNQGPQSNHYDNTPLYCEESIIYPLNTNIMHLYITSSYGNNIIMDTKRATLVNPLSPGKLLHHIKAVSFKLISRHLGHPWEISPIACHKTVLIISQHCSRHWPGAVRRQTITWGNDDPNICCHRVLPGHNELTIAIRYMADNNKYLLIFLSCSLK